jgi:hypothetical protein
MPPILTLDFEASCLPSHGRSCPIEVAVAGPHGFVRSWLIRPHDDWRDATWTAEAQALHGLTWEEVTREGLPAERVLDELAELARGHELFADSYLDAGWMRTLEIAAGASARVRVQHIEALIHRLGVGDEALRRALAEVDGLMLRRHRAAEDARWLQALVARLQSAAGALQPPLQGAA